MLCVRCGHVGGGVRGALDAQDRPAMAVSTGVPAALTSYQTSLGIRERLAQADPGNAGWQRDLALSFGRVALIDAQQDRN